MVNFMTKTGVRNLFDQGTFAVIKFPELGQDLLKIKPILQQGPSVISNYTALLI